MSYILIAVLVLCVYLAIRMYSMNRKMKDMYEFINVLYNGYNALFKDLKERRGIDVSDEQEN